MLHKLVKSIMRLYIKVERLQYGKVVEFLNEQFNLYFGEE